MRSVAVLLVLVNGGFFAWQFWLRSALEAPPPLPSTEIVGTIERLDDAGVGRLVERRPASLEGLGGEDDGGTCVAIGSFTGEYGEGMALGRVREWLERRSGRISLLQRDNHEFVYYWVYFPPLGTHASAKARAEELIVNSFTNAVVIPAGNMKNAVSLGVYGLRSLLERDLVRLKAKGYEPTIRRVYRRRQALWFQVRFPSGFEFPEERFTRAFPGLDVVDYRCPPLPPPPPPIETPAPAPPFS